MRLHTNETLGVWGLGVVGKSYISYLRRRYPHNQIVVYDTRPLSESEHEFLQHHHAELTHDTILQFLARCDRVFVSPGINVHSYPSYREKLYGELNIIPLRMPHKTCAVTGTLGKTTVVTLLTGLLAKVMQVCMAGNIGVPLLNVVDQEADALVLELSSFQLAYNSSYAPDIAIITNAYPNHLDWHSSFEEYVHAKTALFAYSTSEQVVIVTCQLFDAPGFFKSWRACRARKVVVCAHDQAHLSQLVWEVADYVIGYDGQHVLHYIGSPDYLSYRRTCQFSSRTCRDNWLCIYAALEAYGVVDVYDTFDRGDALSHRLEPCGIINGATVYNDSKSTVIEATQHAIDQIARMHKRVHVIVGGLSKGVDRRGHIAQINKHPAVASLVCFGRECAQFPSIEGYPTLSDAVAAIVKNIRPTDALLFSPGGASFDLFANYIERGTYFKSLVNSYETNRHRS